MEHKKRGLALLLALTVPLLCGCEGMVSERPMEDLSGWTIETGADVPTQDAFAAEKNALYADSLRTMSEKDVSEDVRLTLKTLKEKGVRIAVGSSSKNAPTILERIGLYDEFDAISDGNNITKSKPDPEVFLKAAEFLGLTPKDCLVVEDAKAGIDAGKAGGFATAGIGEAAAYEKSDYRLTKLSDLLSVLD